MSGWIRAAVCPAAVAALLLAGCQPGLGTRPVAPVADSTLGFYARVLRGESCFSDLGATGRVRMLVTRVAPGGPAARAGIRPGAILVSVDGHAARNPESMIRLVRNLRPGRMVEVVVHQDGKRRVFRVRAARSREVWGWSQPENLRRSFEPAEIAQPVPPAAGGMRGERERKDENHDQENKAVENFEVPGLHAD